MAMENKVRATYRKKVERRRILRTAMPIIYKGLVWAALIIGWYIIFALVVDMPKEYRLRHSTDELRAEYERLMANPGELDAILADGASRARPVAIETLARVKKAMLG